MRKAEEPLVKVTLNLFATDVDWFKERYGQGWSEIMRLELRRWVNTVKTNETRVNKIPYMQGGA